MLVMKPDKIYHILVITHQLHRKIIFSFRVNANVNNISFTSRRLVLLVEETRIHGTENERLALNHIEYIFPTDGIRTHHSI